MTADRYGLQRFVDAQAPVIERVLQELRNGQKTSHWMWFIFPQISGLGHSDMARFYAIRSRDEAKAYLAHPVLGRRLLDCTQRVLDVAGHSAQAIFGGIDAAKFRSCMTLFAAVADDPSPFRRALRKYYGDQPDQATLDRLSGAYALSVLIGGENEVILGARNGPPLAVGYGDGEMFVGSDGMALGPFTNRIAYLHDGDYVLVDHALSRAERGLAGYLIVDGPREDDIMHAGPAKP